jgi:haloalkane dehalogenase
MSSDTTAGAAWQAEYPFEPHTVEVAGQRLHFVDCGSGPAVVMLHGNPTWSFMYRHLIQGMAPTHRAIAPDHLGCGLSDKPQDRACRLADHIANLETLLDEHLRLKRLSLVLHDWGGAIGMGYAVRHPERIERIVVLNTAAFVLGRCPWRIRVCKIPGFGALAIRGFNAFARGALTMAVGKGHSLDAKARAGLLYPYDSWRNRVGLLRFVQDIPLTSSHPTWDTLATIQKSLHLLADKPMLLCWGGQDFCFNDSYLAVWKRYFPQAAVQCFDDAGHYVLEDAHDRVVPLVRSFLTRRQPPEHGRSRRVRGVDHGRDDGCRTDSQHLAP